jgi:hypothetical protein
MPEADHFARRASSSLAGAARNRATMAIARVWYLRHGSFLAGQAALMATKKRLGRYCVRRAAARVPPERAMQRIFLCAKQAAEHAPCGDTCRSCADVKLRRLTSVQLVRRGPGVVTPATESLDSPPVMAVEKWQSLRGIIRWSPHVASASRALSATRHAHSRWIFAYIEQSPFPIARTITSHSQQSRGFSPPSGASSSPPMAAQAATPRDRSAAAVRLCFAVL